MIDKPKGVSSARCLAPLKRQGQKKIGHAGTLDPMATGVLIILLGQATKISGWLLGAGKKRYSGKIQLGVETDTWDADGEIIATGDWEKITCEAVKTAIYSWLGKQVQEVPAYSAAKHNGQPLYKLARKGQDTPVKLKSAEIYKVDALEISMPFVSFRVECSSGAYIRSLAHSLGTRLECGATLCQLTREYSYPFDLTSACSMDAIEQGQWLAFLKPLNAALPNWPVIELNNRQAEQARNGIGPDLPAKRAGQAFFSHAGKLLAIASYEAGHWKIERGLWNNNQN